MEIFKLVGNIFVDNEKANKNIDETDKKGFKLGKTFQSMGKGALKFGKIMGGAAVAGGAALVALAKKTGDAADRLLDLSSITGMTTDEIQKWEKVSTVAGVSMDAITNVSKKFTKQMDILSTGTGKASEAAERLGLSYDELSNMTADEQMEALVMSLEHIEDPTERAKIGTDLLGGAWNDLAPILDVGKEKLNEIRDNANIISNEDLNQANEFRIKIDQMKEKVIEFGQGLAVKLMPVLNSMFDWISGNMPMIQEVFTNVFNAIGTAIDLVIPIITDFLVPAFKVIFDWVKENLPAIKKIFEDIFKAIGEVVGAFIDVVLMLWDRFGEDIIAAGQAIWDIIKKNFKNALDALMEVFNFFTAIFKGNWSDAWDSFRKILSLAWDNIKNVVQLGVDGLKFIIKTAFNVIKGFAESIFGGVAGIITNIWDGIVDGIKNSINWVIDKINKFIEGVNKIEINLPGQGLDWSPSIKTIPKLQVGGEIVQSGRVMVGEAGPEILDVQEGAKVIPLNKIPKVDSESKMTQVTNEFNINELVVREEADINKIARELFNLQKETERGYGV